MKTQYTASRKHGHQLVVYTCSTENRTYGTGFKKHRALANLLKGMLFYIEGVQGACPHVGRPSVLHPTEGSSVQITDVNVSQVNHHKRSVQSPEMALLLFA